MIASFLPQLPTSNRFPRMFPNLSTAVNAFRGPMRERTAILSLFVLAAALILPAAYVGIPENYDLGQHLRFARTWHEAIGSGAIIPSWGAADNEGLGSAGVRFYPPATHFVMAVLQFGTGSWYDTLWLMMLIWMFVGSVGVFKLANEWSSVPVSYCSAVLYAIVPYHLLQVFQAFLLAEFTAAAILPFCFLYAHRLITKGGSANVLLFAVAYSGLILTHIPTTIFGTLSLSVFILGFLSPENLARSIKQFATAGVFAVATTSFYWVRMVTELSWIKHNTPQYYASGVYTYSTYFFPMFYSAGEVYLPRFLWLFDICIVVTYALFIPSLIVLIKKRFEAPRHMLAMVGVAGFALFMMSAASSPIWDNISLIQKLQFPYRWLSPASLAAALLFPIGVAALVERRVEITRPFAYSLALIITAVIVLDVSQIIVPSAPVPRSAFAKTVDTLDEIPACDCWWPIWATSDALKHVGRIGGTDRTFAVSKWDSSERHVIVGEGSASEIVVGTFYYPYWRATVNESPVEVSKNAEGLIQIPVPTHNPANVVLEFREPTLAIYSRFFSAAMILTLLGWLLVQLSRRFMG